MNKIRWDNVIIALLLLIAFVIFVNNHEAISSFLSTIRELFPKRDPEDKFIGLLAFLACLLSLAIILRIILNRRKNGS